MKKLLLICITLFSFNLLAIPEEVKETATLKHATATFAGGCFWCMEPPFDKLTGVISTTSGYMGGHIDKPSYQQVSRGGTGHAEVVQVIYDPNIISYKKLLNTFWRNIDPTNARGQFCDSGQQYRTEIFYHSAQQQQQAQQTKTELTELKPFDGPIVTEVTAATSFYPAEDYHQDYYQKNPIRYKYYRYSCGRDDRLQQLWGKTDKH